MHWSYDTVIEIVSLLITKLA